MASKKKKDLAPPPQVSDDDDSERSDKDSDVSSDEKKKPAKKATGGEKKATPAKAAAIKTKTKSKSKSKSKSREDSNDDSDASDKSERSADSDDDKDSGDETGRVHTGGKSIISQGKIEANTVKKKVTYKVSIADQNYRPGSGITLTVDIKNQSDKTIKSIQAVLQTVEVVTEGKKKKKKKPVQAGKHEEWFQGARFPLEGYTDYVGTVTYTLPSALPDSSDAVQHQLVVQFDVKKAMGYNHIKLILPVTVRK